MPLTDLQRVRSLIGDMDKSSVQETVTENADGATNQFQLDMFPVRSGTLAVIVSGAAIGSATASFPLGVLDFTGTTTPTAAAQIIVTYQYNALSDDEIQSTIDAVSGAGHILAASLAARGLAGNFARFFSYTQGSKKIDKDKLSSKLMKLAESLEDAYDKNIKLAGTTLTIASYDDSGTAYDEYDTAVASDVSDISGVT